MAYSIVPTVATGDLWTAAQHNTYIRDNFAAGVPDIFTTKGDLAVATGADACSRFAVGSNGYTLEADSAQSVGMKWAGEVAAKARTSGTPSISNNTWTTIDFATVDFQTPGTLITTGASWKFTAPQAGKYFVACYITWGDDPDIGADEYTSGVLRKNGSNVDIFGRQDWQSTGSYVVYMIYSGLISLAASDYIDVQVFQLTGGAVPLAASDHNYISIFRVR